MLRSKDADAILALPTIHHPQLRELHVALASNFIVTKQLAIEWIAAEAERLGLNWLDIEMAHPAQSARAPFVLASSGQQDEFASAVEEHLIKRLGGRHE